MKIILSAALLLAVASQGQTCKELVCSGPSNTATVPLNSVAVPVAAASIEPTNTPGPPPLPGTLARVDPLTDSQIHALFEAQNAVFKAQLHLQNVQARIASEHKMTEQNWMEWRSWYEFDGKFILLRVQNLEISSDKNGIQ